MPFSSKPFSGKWIGLGLVLAAPVLVTATALAQTESATPAAPPVVRHHKHHNKVQKPLVLPPLPGGPLSQVPMELIPATPAKVSFEGGLLTISAQNATLGEILREVRQLTGASIDIPLSPGVNERVVTHLGPGTPRDVLVGLLNGSSFNYVMTGSNSDPAAVASVILTAKEASPGDIQTVANLAPNVYDNGSGPPAPGRFNGPQFNRQNLMAAQQPVPGQTAEAQPAADADDADADDAKDDDNADENAQAQPGQTAQPDAAAVNAQDQSAQDPNQPNAGPKTPEQILEMLRRPPPQPGGAVMPAPQQPPQD